MDPDELDVDQVLEYCFQCFSYLVGECGAWDGQDCNGNEPVCFERDSL